MHAPDRRLMFTLSYEDGNGEIFERCKGACDAALPVSIQNVQSREQIEIYN